MAKGIGTKDVFDRLTDSEDPESAEPVASEDVVEPERESAAPEAIADGRRRPLLRRAVVVLMGATVLAGLGYGGFSAWRLEQVTSSADAGQAALAAAQSYAVTLTSLDSTNIEQNYDAALEGATGQFKNDYSVGAAQLRELLIENKATGTGAVIDGAVKSATKDRVEVLLFVDQSITNILNPDPRIDRNRVAMTMELVEGQWLASKVEML